MIQTCRVGLPSTSASVRFRPKRSFCCVRAQQGGSGGERESSQNTFANFQAVAGTLQALEDYRLLMMQPEPDLLHGAVLIARHRNPQADLATVNDMLDDLAEQVLPTLPEPRYPLKTLNAISSYIYDNRGFCGAANYYDPCNSCIDYVVAEREGIPITLSLVYMEVCRRCGVEVVGVNVPGHFFLTPADPELEFFIDAFNGGRISFLEDASGTLKAIYGRDVILDPGFLHRKDPMPQRIFFARMLNNLKAIYAARKDYPAAYLISCYLRATRPGDVDEIKDAGFILYHLKRYAESAEALQEYLDRAPGDANDIAKVQAVLRKLRGG